MSNCSLTITQAVPIVTWANPPAITYGTPLSTNQLNAMANWSGSFAYTPTIGTVLSQGTWALSAVFTPTDTVNIRSSTKTVSLAVVLPPLQFTVDNGAMEFSWPTNAVGVSLQMITNLSNPDGWVPVSGTIVLGDQNVFITSLSGASAFFRLKVSL